MAGLITSTDNPQIKLVKSLQSRRSARRKHSAYVIEGPNLIREAILSGSPVDKVFFTESFSEDSNNTDLLMQLTERGAFALKVDDAVMEEMSDTQSPQGVLGIVPLVYLPPPDKPDFVVVIDGVSDPGNMGTILRTASAAGVELVILTAGTVDVTNPKVVRAAAGAHFRLPITQLSWEGIMSRYNEFLILLADSHSGAPYSQIDLTQPLLLIVSDEAHGATDEARKAAHTRVMIPMRNQVESLNVSIATAILLFEAARQRSVKE